MCEFKIINKTDGSQLAEDILVLSYTDNNELIIKDVLGMGEQLDSALILDVNTLNQKCIVLQHPLVKFFIGLVKNITENNLKPDQIDEFQKKLEKLKKNL
ncbi:MAG: hypothetical protein ACFFFB_16780 [Candidatus Heimdallarchaeota archaeon]